MSQIEQLEIAVKALPKSDFDEFKRWMLEYDEQQWDRQIEKDSRNKNSPIARLAAKAAADHKLGKTKKL
ncbi:MAG TPA: hypothetical protein VKX17_01175 [Planctomycetota bacterium]|nr:hypothetical protein [Planctomycetota bacterium]